MSQNTQVSLVKKFADRFHVEPEKLLETLKVTAFKQRDGSAPSNEQMMALMVVADQYGLNPFTKEIYAFPDKHNRAIIPVVGVDGWSRIINTNKHFDGIEFRYSDQMVKMPGANVSCPAYIDTYIYRNDRSRPTVVREYLDEVYRPPSNGNKGPWQTHTKRQLRHKGMIQCSRIALGFVGIYDQDEAERIGESAEAYDASVVSPDMESIEHMSYDPSLVEYQKVDPLIDKLVKRARASNAWSSAHQYVEERLTGANLAYASEVLREKGMEVMQAPEQNYEDLQAQSGEETAAGAEEPSTYGESEAIPFGNEQED